MVTFLTLTRIRFFNKFLIISQIQFNRQHIFLLNLNLAIVNIHGNLISIFFETLFILFFKKGV